MVDAGAVTGPARRFRVQKLYPYALIAPSLVVIAAVLVFPFASGIWISFHQDSLMSPTRPFVGLANYRAIAAIPDFLTSTRLTVIWTFGSMVGELVVGTLVALALNRPFRGRGLLRALLLIPWVTPAVVTAVAWRWLYHSEFGVINAVLGPLGLFPPNENWLGDPGTALGAVMVANVWKGFPFWMIMILAGMQAIEPDQYQAARVDGANSWQLFRYVTLPGLKLILTITSILSFVGNFNSFALIYAMTQGGPVDATKILPIYIWQDAFVFFRFGEASAIAGLFALVMAVVILAYARALRLRSAD